MGKTLVTGGAGFIGGHVTRRLCQAGRDVRVLVRPGEDTRNLDGLDVERFEGDVREGPSVRRALEGCDRVFHLAAIYAIWMRDPARIWEVNVAGTRKVCQAALAAGVERLVYTSSIGSLGVAAGKALSDERTPFNQWATANDYVLSKYVSELEVLKWVGRGLPAVITNPAFPFGRGDVAPTPTGGIILALLRGRFPGWFEGGINIVDVEDVARGHLLAEEKGRIGERYILGNENLQTRELMELVARVCGVAAPRRRLPVPLLAGLGTALEAVADHLTHRPPLLTRKGILYSSQHLFYDNGKARRELGWEPQPVEESLRRAAAWFRERGWVGR